VPSAATVAGVLCMYMYTGNGGPSLCNLPVSDRFSLLTLHCIAIAWSWILAALAQLRKVVRLLEKENDQFKRDCENKMSFQRKQEQHLREDNERLRMKVNDLSRPKVSVLAVLEEKQSQLIQQVEAYTAKNELETRNLEELNMKVESVSNRMTNCQDLIRTTIKCPELSQDELKELGYKLVQECPRNCRQEDAPPPGARNTNPDPNRCNVCKTTFRNVWVDKKGDRFKSKGDVERSRAYVPDVKLKKKLAMLEGRVNKTLIKFNESLVVNKSLRAEIEHLRKERMQFDSIQARLENQLNKKKTDIAVAIEATNVALETRDEANKKIVLYRTEIVNNQQEFDAAWRELDNTMDSEEKRRRQVKAKMEEEEKRKKSTVDDDAVQRKQLEELTAKYETSKADVQRFQEAFAQLQEATGLKDVDELVTTFVEAEEQNFRLFKFLNELNEEQDRLTNEVHMIAEEAERAASLNAQRDNHEFKKEQEDQLAHMEARAEELSELEETESTKVREVLKIIRRLYDELGCSHLINTDDTFQCDSSGQPIIADSNMLYFLGVIEQRARDLMNRLINEQAVAVDDGARRDITLSCLCPLGMGPSAPVGASKLNVQPPKIDT
jgi:chromosome segregation ATPase